MLNKIELLGGKIISSDFNIDFNVPLNEQKCKLQQDLLQIQYGEHYLIDVGWHPMFDPDGFLLIQIIKDYDWENPICKIKIEAKEIKQFPECLNEAIQLTVDLKNESYIEKNE